MPKQKKQLDSKSVKKTAKPKAKPKSKAKPKIKIKKITPASRKKHTDSVIDLKKNFSEIYHDADELLDDDVTEEELDEQDSNFDWGDLLEGEDEESDDKQIKKKKHSKYGEEFKKKKKQKKSFSFLGFGKHKKNDSDKHKFDKESYQEDKLPKFHKSDKIKEMKINTGNKKLSKKISKDVKGVMKELPDHDLKKGFPMRIYRKLAVGFVLLAIILVAVIFYFSFVKATITIKLKQNLDENSMTISVYERAEDYVIPDNAVRGLVKKIELEQSKSYDVSGSEIIGEEVTGFITIVNNYSKNQPLVATTRFLSSDGKLFRLRNSVNVPAGKSITAEVYADQTDIKMVVGDDKFIIPGLWEGLQDQIYGESKAGDITYKKKLKKVVKQEDIDLALVDLQEILITQAKADIDDTYGEYNQKLYEIDTEAIDYKVDSKIGEETDKITVTMKATIIMVAFDDSQVYELVKMTAGSNLPASQELTELQVDKFIYNIVDIDLERQIADVEVQFSGLIKLKPDAKLIDKSEIINMSKGELSNYLSQIKDIKSFDIKINPSFITKTPSLVDRIKIEIE